MSAIVGTVMMVILLALVGLWACRRGAKNSPKRRLPKLQAVGPGASVEVYDGANGELVYRRVNTSTPDKERNNVVLFGAAGAGARLIISGENASKFLWSDTEEDD